jgi:hypothetical protein
MLRRKDEWDQADGSVILSEGLMDESGNFYDLTLEMAIQEESRGQPLIDCHYVIDTTGFDRTLKEFIAYTEHRVIFMLLGIGLKDALLYSVRRYPHSIK